MNWKFGELFGWQQSNKMKELKIPSNFEFLQNGESYLPRSPYVEIPMGTWLPHCQPNNLTNSSWIWLNNLFHMNCNFMGLLTSHVNQMTT